MPRVILRAPSLRDESAFLAAARRGRRLHHPFAHPPLTSDAFRRYVRRARGPDHAGHFVIDPHTGALAAVVNLNEIVRGQLQSAYLGYYAFAGYAGRGFVRAGVARVLDVAFGSLGLHRVEANIQPENRRSVALVKRLGFRREGYSPRYLQIAGVWRDHERWALLCDEWRPGRTHG